MKIVIQYKHDGTSTPFCAFTWIGEDYQCAWSADSFEAAKRSLVSKLEARANTLVPEPETVEISPTVVGEEPKQNQNAT